MYTEKSIRRHKQLMHDDPWFIPFEGKITPWRCAYIKLYAISRDIPAYRNDLPRYWEVWYYRMKQVFLFWRLFNGTKVYGKTDHGDEKAWCTTVNRAIRSENYKDMLDKFGGPHPKKNRLFFWYGSWRYLTLMTVHRNKMKARVQTLEVWKKLGER